MFYPDLNSWLGQGSWLRVDAFDDERVQIVFILAIHLGCTCPSHLKLNPSSASPCSRPYKLLTASGGVDTPTGATSGYLYCQAAGFYVDSLDLHCYTVVPFLDPGRRQGEILTV